jgi:hypothetical protein
LDGLYAEGALGETALIPAEALRDLFAMPAISSVVQLVVLAACLSDSQADAVARSIPAVIGMRGSVLDETVLAFSRGLYMALGQGLSAAEAFEFGRNAIKLEGIAESDLPHLFATSRNAAASVRPFPNRG